MAGLAFVTERVVVVNGQVESSVVTGERVVRPPVDQVRLGPGEPHAPARRPRGSRAGGQARGTTRPGRGSRPRAPIPFGTRVTVTDLGSDGHYRHDR
jgi:hypothetical protein